MTRTDYEVIAQAVRTAINNGPTDLDTWRGGVTDIVKVVAESMKRQNPRFRYDTFYEACGLDAWGDMK